MNRAILTFELDCLTEKSSCNDKSVELLGELIGRLAIPILLPVDDLKCSVKIKYLKERSSQNVKS